MGSISTGVFGVALILESMPRVLVAANTPVEDAIGEDDCAPV